MTASTVSSGLDRLFTNPRALLPGPHRQVDPSAANYSKIYGYIGSIGSSPATRAAGNCASPAAAAFATNSDRPEMLPHSLRRWISIVGTAAAVITAVVIPLGYGLVAHDEEAETLAFKARLNASRVSKYIYTHGSMWPFHRVRLTELIELTEAPEDEIRQRIFDPNGKLVLEAGSALAAPVMARSAPIVVNGENVAQLEVEMSMRPLIYRMQLVAGISLLLGLLIYLALRALPIRLLDQAFSTLQRRDEELERQRNDFEAAIENMPHGLGMFDRDGRLVVHNSSYLRMYGLSAADIRPGMMLRTILEVRAAKGTYPSPDASWLERRLDRITRGELLLDRLADGRIIAVTRNPVANGGWVSVHQDVTEQKRAEDRIAHMAHYDALTGLPNRVLLYEKLMHHLGQLRDGAQLAVLCLDLDQFKQVNDTLGHSVGDALLSGVGRRLRECIRESDIVARLGGDEFAIIQTGMAQPTSATKLAQRLVEQMTVPFEAAGHEVAVFTSIGIAVAPVDGTDAEQLLRSADLALYRAKDQGRNGFCFFEPGMDASMHERRNLEIDLRRAISQEEFQLVYQPVMNLAHNRVSGFEALLRWHHPSRGMVPPAQFVALAEETGLIVPIGEWVLRQACADAADWPDDIRVAVNISPVQFRSKNLAITVVSALAAAGLAPERLEIEITESSLLQSNEATLAVLYQLQGIGVRVAMDDFGTGYSSLSYLRSFPFDKIKIDQSFVRDLDRTKDAVAIVRAVSSLAAELGMITTAEGVDTINQLERVRAEGCAEAQGYLFSPPQPASEVPRMLAIPEPRRQAVA